MPPTAFGGAWGTSPTIGGIVGGDTLEHLAGQGEPAASGRNEPVHSDPGEALRPRPGVSAWMPALPAGTRETHA